ncbi:response regulator [Pontibacter silvestris]
MGYIEKVLIIDDDETSIFLTKRILSSMGIGSDVQTALNGLDGLKLLSDAKKKQLPQLILLDVRMQGIDGFTFL